MRRGEKVEQQVKQAIEDYIDTYGAASTRTIADYVYAQLGIRPGGGLIAQVLKEKGYKPLASFWVKS